MFQFSLFTTIALKEKRTKTENHLELLKIRKLLRKRVDQSGYLSRNTQQHNIFFENITMTCKQKKEVLQFIVAEYKMQKE